MVTKRKPKPQKWPFIRKRAGKWMVDARTKDGGSRKFFETLAEAETYQQQCRIQRENSGTSAFGNVELAKYGKTIHDAVAFYLKHLAAQEKTMAVRAAVDELIDIKNKAGMAARYCADLRSRLGRFCEVFGERPVRSVTTAELDQWLAGLGNDGSTKNAYRRKVSTLFNFCQARGLCAENPARRTQRSNESVEEVKILEPEEAERLLAACDRETLPFVAIGLFAGLRDKEIKKLTWEEIHLDESVIEVKAKNAKTRSHRVVPVQPNLAAWLRPFAATGPIVGKAHRRRFETARTAAKLFAGWEENTMRHSFGSYRLAKINDVQKVSLEMGNTPEKIFRHYRKPIKPAAVEKFWNVLPTEATNIISMKGKAA